MYTTPNEKRWAKFFESLKLKFVYSFNHQNERPSFFMADNATSLWFHILQTPDPTVTAHMIEFSKNHYCLVGIITGQPWPGLYNILMVGYKDGVFGITLDQNTRTPMRCIFGLSDCQNVSVDIYVKPVEAARALVSPLFITAFPCPTHHRCTHYVLMEDTPFTGPNTPLHSAYLDAAKP